MKKWMLMVGALSFFSCGVFVGVADAAESLVHYVDVNSINPVAPYESWETATPSIQVAVDISASNNTVMVADGYYLLTSEVLVTNPVTIFSVNGPEVTIVDGGGSNRCFNLGSSAAMLVGLTITNGSSSESGGGVFCSDITPAISNCFIVGNSAWGGGGMSGGRAYSCSFIDNEGGYGSGGLINGNAYGSYFSGNSAEVGGGMGGGEAYHCTFVRNRATWYAGGMSYGKAYNCVFFRNTARGIEDNISSTNNIFYSRSFELVHGVNGNITNSPLMISSFRIAPDSPCRGAGSPAYSIGSDIDGEGWLPPPSMGCDEYHGLGTVSGPLLLSLVGPTNLCAGFISEYSIDVQGNPTGMIVDFGDGRIVTNDIYMRHAWSAAGIYDVIVTAFNDDNPTGVSMTQAVEVEAVDSSSVYVSVEFGDDVNDGRSWASPKQTIQAGVDIQFTSGGIVWISNGIYSVSSEVQIPRTMRILGVNIPELTVLDGGGVSRCMNLTAANSVVVGLTITNGYSALDGGGLSCLNSTVVISNCVITGNVAENGGGMLRGYAYDCLFENNKANQSGGGLSRGESDRCWFIDNLAPSQGGGGARESSVYNCLFKGNKAQWGAAISFGSASHCTFTENISEYSIVSDSGLSNCILWGNRINSGGDGWGDSSCGYTCAPGLKHGVGGNITNSPQLVSSFRIAPDSPCRGVANPAYSTGSDIDGEVWLTPPSMGCDEYHGPGTVGGSLLLSLVGSTNLCAGFISEYSIDVQGNPTGMIVDFGDGRIVTNDIYMRHAWSAAGIYDVIVTAFNDDNPAGVSMTQAVEVEAADSSAVYVSAEFGDDVNDGRSWALPKQTIQAGHDAQGVLGGYVFVSNGTYEVSSEISISNSVRILSINGASVTFVDGGGATRCFNLSATGAEVGGITITNGYAGWPGAGAVLCAHPDVSVSDCIISGNTGVGAVMRGGNAYRCTFSNNHGDFYGGGMAYGKAYNCVFSNNTAGYEGAGGLNIEAHNCLFVDNSAIQYHGGGMSRGSAYNCTFVRNSAPQGGGILGDYGGAIDNCIFWQNTASNSGADISGYYADAYYSCSSELAQGINGNITNAPLFVDEANGDYRLRIDSPCIDIGFNGSVTIPFDLDGNDRIVNGSVDMGAYEFDSSISYTPDSDFTYTTNNGAITITGYVGTNKAVNIPGTINGLSVVNIEDYALQHCPLTSITIPNGVTNIGVAAFKFCESLVSVTLPETMKTIRNDAFFVCSRLNDCVIPSAVERIGDYAFAYSELSSVVLSSGLKHLGVGPFRNCSNLTNISVSGDNVFYTDVDGVLFNKSQTVLIQYPAGLVDLSYLISGSVTNIADSAFAGSRLSHVDIPHSVVRIERDGFWDCSDLENITLPNGLVEIERLTFMFCHNLSKIVVPSGVTNIGEMAFYGCTSLASVYFLADAPVLESDVFQGCDNATVYYLLGTTGWTNPWGGRPTVMWDGDLDSDGLPDAWEVHHFGSLDPEGNGDPDDDGLSNAEEFVLGTAPRNSDTDGDGVSDLNERVAGTSPTNSTSVLNVACENLLNGSRRLSWFGVQDRDYTIEYRESLLLGSWQSYPFGFWGLGNTISITDSSFVPQRFYRVRVSGNPEEIQVVSPPEGMVAIPAGMNSGTNPVVDGESYGSWYPATYSLTVDAFWMGETEVTNDEMIRVMQWAYDHGRLAVSSAGVTNAMGGSQELLDLDSLGCRVTWDGSSFGMKSAKGAGYPCVEVSWYGSAAYCNYRSEMEGKELCYDLSDWSSDLTVKGYRLPTSEEWEYAARGGLNGKRFPWGDTINHSQANYKANGSVCSYDTSPYAMGTYHPDYDDGGYPYTSLVGMFVVDGYGLVDMGGNVWEWCNDGASSSRVVRGGSWANDSVHARCGSVYSSYSDSSYNNRGFRAVCY